MKLKRLIVAILAVLIACMSAFVFAACDKDDGKGTGGDTGDGTEGTPVTTLAELEIVINKSLALKNVKLVYEMKVGGETHGGLTEVVEGLGEGRRWFSLETALPGENTVVYYDDGMAYEEVATGKRKFSIRGEIGGYNCPEINVVDTDTHTVVWYTDAEYTNKYTAAAPTSDLYLFGRYEPK